MGRFALIILILLCTQLVAKAAPPCSRAFRGEIVAPSIWRISHPKVTGELLVKIDEIRHPEDQILVEVLSTQFKPKHPHGDQWHRTFSAGWVEPPNSVTVTGARFLDSILLALSRENGRPYHRLREEIYQLEDLTREYVRFSTKIFGKRRKWSQEFIDSLLEFAPRSLERSIYFDVWKTDSRGKKVKRVANLRLIQAPFGALSFPDVNGIIYQKLQEFPGTWWSSIPAWHHFGMTTVYGPFGPLYWNLLGVPKSQQKISQGGVYRAPVEEMGWNIPRVTVDMKPIRKEELKKQAIEALPDETMRQVLWELYFTDHQYTRGEIRSMQKATDDPMVRAAIGVYLGGGPRLGGGIIYEPGNWAVDPSVGERVVPRILAFMMNAVKQTSQGNPFMLATYGDRLSGRFYESIGFETVPLPIEKSGTTWNLQLLPARDIESSIKFLSRQAYATDERLRLFLETFEEASVQSTAR